MRRSTGLDGIGAGVGQQAVVLGCAWSMPGVDQSVTQGVLSIVLLVHFPTTVFWYVGQHMRVLWMCIQADLTLPEAFATRSGSRYFNALNQLL